ncbi:MAG: hypothetical protein AB7O96_09570 [Pseudobdellovibrionaceae bacterium]
MKKPLCINSKSVESLDRVEGTQLSQIWGCQHQKAVPFDAGLWKVKTEIEKSLHKVETRVKFVKPVSITLRDDRSNYFRVTSSNIELGAELLKQPRVLERALYKAWIKQVELQADPTLKASDLLTEEVLADILVYSHFGVTEFTEPESTLWPNVVKSGGGYCASEWMSLEHTQFCALASAQGSSKMTNFTDLSLRPLLTTSLREAYRGLSVREQIYFSDWVYEFLNTKKDKYSKAVGSYLGLGERITAFADRIGKTSTVGEKLKARMKEQLLSHGFLFDEPEMLNIDMAYLISGRLESQASLFADMVDFAKQEPKKRLAIIDQDYIWLLPSIYPLRRNLFPKVHIKNALSQFCGWPTISDLRTLKGLADRVLTVNSCNRTSIRISGFVGVGAEAFAKQNPNLAFAQFHLPSIDLLGEIAGLKDFQLISAANKELATVPQMGLQKPIWNENVKAFRVRSAIEAIEWYRF